jgi:exosortase/archaeosortase family protein
LQRRLIVRFALIFLVSLAAFYALVATPTAQEYVVRPCLDVSARASAALLRVMGYETTASGSYVASRDYIVNIKRGCDAIDPSALFVSAVLASPVSRALKLPGLVSGVLLLLSLNLMRIVSLFLVGLYIPRFFETLHVTIWQSCRSPPRWPRCSPPNAHRQRPSTS